MSYDNFVCFFFSYCDAGRMICQDIQCPQECKIIGYNNVVTFDGESYNFDYEGQLCYFTLAEVKVIATEK